MATLPVPPTGARRLVAPVRFIRRLQALPPRVAWFQARARLRASRIRDDAAKSALRPDDLVVLLELARGRREVVELGTAKAWTTISLALADGDRRVRTYDPVAHHPVREAYLSLAPRSVRERIAFMDEPGESGPRFGAPAVDFLFIDASHQREATVRQYEAWRLALAPGAVVVFDDYGHPHFPGVKEAVEQLGLDGVAAGLLFMHPTGGASVAAGRPPVRSSPSR